MCEDMFKKFTERARKVIILAREQAEKNQHEYLGTEHLLLGIIQDTGGVAIAVLQRLSIDLRQIRLEIEKNMPPSSNSLVVGDIPFTSRAKKVLEYSVEEARSLGDAYIGTEHLLLGLMREKDGVGARVLTQMKVTYADVKEHTLSLLREPTVGQEKQQVSKTPALEEFGRDLTELALKNELDPVIGRDEEIQRLLQILSRRTKNNPVLIGEAGVGKTAIVEGMAQKIVSREVPQILHSKRVISLDLGAVIAGTKYRGQFEQRIKAIMKEIIRSKKIILFIDELHTLVGAGAAEGSVDASNMLKPALSRGDIQCIGATTLDEYRKYIEKNGALERRFQSIIVQPPNIKETIDIIYGLKSKYEQHHNAIFSDEAIKAAVRMSDRYIPDRFLPDKAIDVIDEAGSKVHLKKVTFPDEMKELQVAIDAIVKEKKERISKQEFEKAVELRDQEEKLHVDLDKMRYDWELAQEDSVPVVTHDDIAYVVSMIADIPLQKVAKGESEKLLKLSLELKKHIFGQDEAVNSISKAIRRSRMGLKEVDRPMGVFLFVGPTGVGKTELANALAECMFGDKSALIRLDMSEYMEKFNSSKLVGAPPGYIGYEEGGQLTERVRRRPYSVVLLDEIEKAHRDIYNVLLQIMDDGVLTDSLGRKVSFKNVILIMTSNLTSKTLENDSIGFQVQNEEHTHDKMEGEIKAELRRTFNPEFLNRIDEIVTFRKLNVESLGKIADIRLNELTQQLADEGLECSVDQNAREFIVKEGYNPKYGARPLKRAIQRLIENPLSEQMLRGDFKSGDSVNVALEDGEIVFKGESPQDKLVENL